MKPFAFRYESMGTHWEVSIWDELSPERGKTLRDTIVSWSRDFDNTYSRFIATSFVSHLSTQTGMVQVPPDFIPILRMYLSMFHLSGKKVTPLVGTTLSDMGYDKEYSLHEKQVIHPVPDLENVVEICDDSHIKIKEPVLFDFGALGKGYFVDKIARLLSEKNIKRFLVNGSGDIAYRGNGIPINTGLEHPKDPKKVIGTLEITHGSVCSSGSNRRSWGNHHHIIDPQSLQSTTEILSTWVWASSATIADALATALFLTPPEQYRDHFDFEYLILNKEMRVKRSQGFKMAGTLV